MKVLCHLSGGFDSVASTLVAANELDVNDKFSTVFYAIGQPYESQEREAANYVVSMLRSLFPDKYVGHHELSLNILASFDPNLPSAYIPVRNLVLSSSSANLAIALGYDKVAVGNKTIAVREDDPYSFSDCSVKFYSMMSDISTFASEGKKLEFIMPLVLAEGEDMYSYTKDEVMGICESNGIDLTKLWSCYENGVIPCGVCYHCQEIKKTSYSDRFFKE